MNFKDHFSAHAGLYAKFRPSYPKDLFAWLQKQSPAQEIAWDCGTGNGQAACLLTEYFDRVIATDPSEEQISHAVRHSNVEYRTEPAEQTSIGDQTVDLVTVANALHWFNFDAFYREVNRVIKPGGLIAAWSYRLPEIDEMVDELIQYLHDDILCSFWLPENRLVEKAYTTIPFPFEEIPAPLFYYEKSLSLDELCGYLLTWSAAQRYIREKNHDPVGDLREQLAAAWGNSPNRLVKWKMTLRVGRSNR
jgi:SAM-dependent methyltransferase